jgi:hypothetical protein
MVNEIRSPIRSGLAIVAVLMTGCAFDLADVKYDPAQLGSLVDGERVLTMDSDTPVSGAPCGYSRTLRKGTRWVAVGHLEQGDVYRSRDQSLTVECSNVYEAYPVIAADRLVGFYLPVEKAFSPLKQAIQLSVSRQPGDFLERSNVP